MKDIREVTKQKELELNQLRMDLSALYRVIPLLADASDPKPELPEASAPEQTKAGFP